MGDGKLGKEYDHEEVEFLRHVIVESSRVIPQKRQFLPYVFAIAFSTVLVQALILGYDTAGMRGVFIASAAAYVPLGLIVGFIWSPNPLVAGALAGIPPWLFIFALHQWQIFKALTTIVEDVPLALEPLSVSLFFVIGAWIGEKLSALRRQQQGHT